MFEVAYITANLERVCSDDVTARVLSQQNERLFVLHRMTLMCGKDLASHDVNPVC
jgi:hypothetical protein